MKSTYPLFDIYWDETDVQAVTSIIQRGSYWAAGPEISKFEEKLAEFYDVKYTLVMNSGTSALHSLLIACDLNGAEVITPSFSFISTVNSIVLAGGKPVFADIERDSFGLDYEDVKQKITPKTKAIIIMHYGGFAARDIYKIRNLAQEKDILLLEDNAESFGADYNGNLLGTIGDASILSFCQNKIITTGEGGAILTNRKYIYEKAKLLRSHGRVEEKNINFFEKIDFSEYIDIGYNYRLPTMNAALGISQLEKIEIIISKRREIAQKYNSLLSKIPEIKILKPVPASNPVYQFYSILLNNPKQRSSLQQFLLEKGIFTKVNFDPIHHKASFQKYKSDPNLKLPTTLEISRKQLTLPFLFHYNDDYQKTISNCIKSFFNKA